MITAQRRAIAWIDKFALLAIAVGAAQLHSLGAPERAEVAGQGVVAAGVLLGVGIMVILVARLFGKSLPFISSDRAAILAVICLVAVKVVIARVVLGI